jgi:hypothetical protein
MSELISHDTIVIYVLSQLVFLTADGYGISVIKKQGQRDLKQKVGVNE